MESLVKPILIITVIVAIVVAVIHTYTEEKLDHMQQIEPVSMATQSPLIADYNGYVTLSHYQAN